MKNNEIDVLVTAPINKANIQSEDFNFPGHTDYLAQELGGQQPHVHGNQPIENRIAYRSRGGEGGGG